MNNGKIYLGDILVSDPSSGGGGVEYVTFTFSGGNTFKFCGLTDKGYLDDYTINGSGTLNVVKNSICIIGKMKFSMIQSVSPSNLTFPTMSDLSSNNHPARVGVYGNDTFSGNTITSWSSGDSYWQHAMTIVAGQDITFYADVD